MSCMQNILIFSKPETTMQVIKGGGAFLYITPRARDNVQSMTPSISTLISR